MIIQRDLKCSVCGTARTTTYKRGIRESEGKTVLLWCTECKADRYFVELNYKEPGQNTKKNPDATRDKKRKRPVIIGVCSFPAHKMELTKSVVEEKGCIEKRCNHFSWAPSWTALCARDSAIEHGWKRKPAITREGTPAERTSRRRLENLRFLEATDIGWKWVDEKTDHIVIGENLDYYLGSTRWHDRTINEGGYAMLSKLLRQGGATDEQSDGP